MNEHVKLQLKLSTQNPEVVNDPIGNSLKYCNVNSSIV